MSEESANETALDLKKRARRRLVGAAALALLAIIVLPIVMDSEPKTTGPEIQVVIPGQDVHSVSTSSPPASMAPASANLRPEPKGDGISAKMTTLTPPMAAGVSTVPPAAPIAEAPRPALAATTQSSEKSPNETAAGKSKALASSGNAQALVVLEGKEGDQWFVLLGAYQNSGNVKQLSAKVKELGLPVFTEKADSSQGTRTRVRSGPFKTREAADKARIRIKKIGVDGQVAQK